MRNIPFDATEEALKKEFSQYGHVLFATIVRDKITGLSRGTAFLKFKVSLVYSTKSLILLLIFFKKFFSNGVLAPQYRTTADKVIDIAAKNPEQTLSILGRPVKISLAVEREEAEKLTRAKKAKGRIDRRNLYLANEGLIVEDDGLEVTYCVERPMLLFM